MIIHPECNMYNQHLQHWRSVQLKIRYNKKTSVERIWMNYTKPKELHTYQYIGKNCWQRQAYKRKAARFLKKGLPISFPEGSYIEDMFRK